LLIRFNEDHYIPNSKTTIGVDYKAKEIVVDNEPVKLQVCIIDKYYSVTAPAEQH
jgi:GTPase SAR1 family protein